MFSSLNAHRASSVIKPGCFILSHLFRALVQFESVTQVSSRRFGRVRLTLPKTMPRIYRGWWVVSAPFLAAALGTGAGQYGFGIFIEPWSRHSAGAAPRSALPSHSRLSVAC